jgi:hypothetical protein
MGLNGLASGGFFTRAVFVTVAAVAEPNGGTPTETLGLRFLALVPTVALVRARASIGAIAARALGDVAQRVGAFRTGLRFRIALDAELVRRPLARVAVFGPSEAVGARASPIQGDLVLAARDAAVLARNIAFLAGATVVGDRNLVRPAAVVVVVKARARN